MERDNVHDCCALAARNFRPGLEIVSSRAMSHAIIGFGDPPSRFGVDLPAARGMLRVAARQEKRCKIISGNTTQPVPETQARLF
jgi:hypothetical protein